MQQHFNFSTDNPDIDKKSEEDDSVKLDEVVPADEGGAINIQGIEYQNEFAVNLCLGMMLEDSDIEFVSSESHEDIAVKTRSRGYKFYQVKTKRQGAWTIADLNSANVWKNFLRLQRIFGNDHAFLFVSEQTTSYGRRPKFDLGKMKILTQKGKKLCNEKELIDADSIIDRLMGLSSVEFQDRTEAECLFWNTRILTDTDHFRGLRADNSLSIEGILEQQQIQSNLQSRCRISLAIKDLITSRITPEDEHTLEEILRARQLKANDIEECFREAEQITQSDSFLIHDVANIRNLRQKTIEARFPPQWSNYFIDYRNQFASRYRKDVIYAEEYLSRLRLRVWDVCNEQKLDLSEPYKSIVEYRVIRSNLKELLKTELETEPPIKVDFDYLHGMMCQLTAECCHDWYSLSG